MSDPQNRFICAVCGTPSLMCCSQCNNVFYCSQEHQKQHWKLHKQDCLHFQEEMQNQIYQREAQQSPLVNQLKNDNIMTPQKPYMENERSPYRINNFMQNNNTYNQTVPKIKQSYTERENLNSDLTTQNWAQPQQQQFQPQQYAKLLTNSQKELSNSPQPGGHTIFNINNSPNKLFQEDQQQYLQQQQQYSNGNNNNYNQHPSFSPSPSNQQMLQNSSSNNLQANRDGLNTDISNNSPNHAGQLTNLNKSIQSTSRRDVFEMNPEQLLNERKKLRSIMVNLYGNFNYAGCIVPCKKLVSVDKRLYDLHTQYSELYEFLADYLFLSKILVKIDKPKSARECLIIVQKTVNDLFDDQHLLLRREAVQMVRGEFQFTSAALQKQREDLLNDVRKRCNILALCANLFFAVGDSRNCEAMYVKYVQLVETIFGAEALETSNCYFLVGVYYIQQKCFTKALACMKRALHTRRMKLGEQNECVADCQYNMGVIFKQIGQKVKAMEYLNAALDARRELIGDVSLPVAQALEAIGKVCLEDQDFKSALTRFQESYVIRKKILHNNSHPDMIRISLLIIHLFNCVKAEMQRKQQNKKTFEMLQGITDQIKNSVLDPNLNSYINTDRSQIDRYSEIQSFFKANGPSTSRQDDFPTSTDRDNKSNNNRGVSGSPNNQRQNQQQKQDNDDAQERKNKYFKVSKELFGQFPLEILLPLTALQDELKHMDAQAQQAQALAQQQDSNYSGSNNAAIAQKFNPNVVIAKHDFMKILSQNELFYIQFQKDNQHIFTDKSPEVVHQIQEYEMARKQKLANRNTVSMSALTQQQQFMQNGLLDFQPNFGGGGIGNSTLGPMGGNGQNNLNMANMLIGGQNQMLHSPSGPTLITHANNNPMATPYMDQISQPYSHLQPNQQFDSKNLPMQGANTQFQQQGNVNQNWQQQQQQPPQFNQKSQQNLQLQQQLQQQLLQQQLQFNQQRNLSPMQLQIQQMNQNQTAGNPQSNGTNTSAKPPHPIGISLVGMNSNSNSQQQLNNNILPGPPSINDLNQQQNPYNNINNDQMQSINQKLMMQASQLQQQQNKLNGKTGDQAGQPLDNQKPLLKSLISQQLQNPYQPDDKKLNNNNVQNKSQPQQKTSLNQISKATNPVKNDTTKKAPFTITKSPRNSNDNNNDQSASNNSIYDNKSTQDMQQIQQKLLNFNITSSLQSQQNQSASSGGGGFPNK